MAPLACCWCGAEQLSPFSADYLQCAACETLVASEMPSAQALGVNDDETDFYGRRYHESYMVETHGAPTLDARARLDLPERCLHWLRATLKYKLPPARVLEIGSAHGGFVALLRWAGFDAQGLELSPTVVRAAERAFQVPMSVGPIENQSLPQGSFDCVALMDVLEHLRDPVGTMGHVMTLLKPDGIVLVQTPRLPAGCTYGELVARQDKFLDHLNPGEHLFLFSESSVRTFLQRLGCSFVAFEPAIFSIYDMFLVAARVPVAATTVDQTDHALLASPTGRLVLALIDLGAQAHEVRTNWIQAEADRAARLEVITRLARENDVLRMPWYVKLSRWVRSARGGR